MKGNNKKNRRFLVKSLSYLLCLCLLISNLSLTAFASEPVVGTEEEGQQLDIDGNEILEQKEDIDSENADESQDDLDSDLGEISRYEEELSPSEEELVFEYDINPIYAQWYDPEELLAEARAEEAARRAEKRDCLEQAESLITCTTNEEAVAYLCQQMVLRKESITVYKTSGVTLGWSELLHAAMEDNGSAKGKEGDYLRYQYGGASGSPGSSAFSYKISYYSTYEKELEVDAHLEKVYADLDLKNKTDIEKIDAIYSYVTDHAYYDYYALESGVNVKNYPQAWSAWGNLIKGKSVCQGFAITLYRMMKDNGIQVRVVTGPGHAWNIVEYDGVWYNMDSTWDCSDEDSNGNSQHNGGKTWYMCSPDDFPKHSRDEQFDTDDFHAKYPMAAVSYGKPETTEPETLNANNYTGTFSTVDGGTFSVTASETDVMKILIFARATNASTVKSVLSGFQNKGILGLDGVTTAFIPVSNESKDTMVTCKDDVGYDITYCYDTTNAANSLMKKYVQGPAGISGGFYIPVCVIIDKNNKVRAVSFSYPGSEFYDVFDWVLAETYGRAEISSVVQAEGGNLVLWEGLTGAESYNVYRAYQKKSEYRLIGSTTETSYIDETADPEIGYWYKVEAIFKGKGTGKSAPVQVRVPAKPEKVILNASYLDTFVGVPGSLTASVVSNVEGEEVSQEVIWSSSSPDVVSVSADGGLTAKAPGTAVIKAASKVKESVSAQCTVTVKEDYTITYVLNGGEFLAEPVRHYNPFTGRILLEEPVKEDYSFVGWYTASDPEKGEKLTEIADGTDEGNITLYAIWRELDQVAIPVADKESEEEVMEDSFIHLESETEGAKIYYTLDGTEPDESANLYTAQGIRMKYEDVLDGLITLKAIALKDGYRKSEIAVYLYKLKEDVFVKEILLSPVEAAVFAGEKLKITATVIPDKEGRNISQEVTWSSEEEETVTVDENGYIQGLKAGETVIHAISKLDPNVSADCKVTVKRDYSITYELNGGTLNAEPINHYNPYSEPILLEVPVKEGYTFVGWFTQNDALTGNKMETIAKGTDEGDITLYAIWVEKSRVAMPISDVKSGEIVLEDSVIHLGSVTENAEIHYTLDGSEPTVASAIYTDGIEIKYEDVRDGKIILKAFALKKDFEESKVVTYEYEFKEVVAAKEVILDVTEGELLIGESMQVHAEIIPDKEGRNISQAVIWSSSNERIASVDENGLITGVAFGRTVIRATSVLNPQIYAECQAVVIDTDQYGDILPEDIPEDGEIPDGIWVAGIKDVTYTGKAITFPLRVYDHNRRLVEKQDYTVSYKNNKNAGSADAVKNAPTVTITGKGNYNDKIVKTFNIKRKTIGNGSLPDEAIYVEVPVLVVNGKNQKAPYPNVVLNGVKLSAKKDFKATSNNTTYKDAGVYEKEILIEGIGNYDGSFYADLIIAPKETKTKLLKNATITYEKSVVYTGSEIKPSVTVRFGKEQPVDSLLYDVEYSNNIEVGTATIIIRGKRNEERNEELVGSKAVTFKITQYPMSKVTVTDLLSDSTYTGFAVDAGVAKLTNSLNGDKLVLGEDYTISYKKNNTDAGTVTVMFTGKGKYSGILKKTFKISTYNIETDNDKLITVDYDVSVPYAKGGSKPKVKVTFKKKQLTDGLETITEQILEEGRDYTVSYQNNKAVTTEKTTKKPMLSIKGKGNFAGTIKNKEFEIIGQKISDLEAAAPDIVNKEKAGQYFATPKVTDIDGKVLKAGTDYDKRNIAYYYGQNVTLKDGVTRSKGDPVLSTDVIPIDVTCTIRAEITGLGNYKGDSVVTAYYRIVRYDIAKVKKVFISPQEYTGNPVEPQKGDITIYKTKIDENDILSDDNYEIKEYSGQSKKGKSYLVIEGTGEYGGMKKCTFNIGARSLKEFLKKFSLN